MTDMQKPKLLILDDEEDLPALLKRSLSSDLGCDVDTAARALDALALLDRIPYDVALADVRMPGMDGIEFLRRAKENCPNLTVVMMTAFGSIDLAVQAIKAGAYDFITKPFEHDKLLLVTQNAIERSRLMRENLRLQEKVREQEMFHEMIGVSAKMSKIFGRIRLIAKTDATALITGESGSGKDMAARAIHYMSDRRDQAYVAVNCPNLPENILESELFGYKRGAFTHALHDKKGLFWEARGGTIYLDEIGDISGALQIKLLRVLQEKEIRPVGGTKNIKVDVRIIASTNRDLAQRIKDNEFREDLFYRLNVLPLHMPPLRERRDDIPLLANHFLNFFCKEHRLSPKRIAPALMQRFLSNPWRGNVRELQNTVSRAALLAPGDEIHIEDAEWTEEPGASRCLFSDQLHGLPYKDAKAQALVNFHQEYLGTLLTRTLGNVTKAARECGLERQALQQVMRRYGVKSRAYAEDSE
jgi:DNA-binding NtrC family response regulator